MSWYKVTFLPGEMATGRHSRLCDEFEALFGAEGAPREAVMFSDADVTVRAYYFSPRAAAISEALITDYAGVECAAPSKSTLRPVVCRDGREEALFPAHRM